MNISRTHSNLGFCNPCHDIFEVIILFHENIFDTVGNNIGWTFSSWHVDINACISNTYNDVSVFNVVWGVWYKQYYFETIYKKKERQEHQQNYIDMWNACVPNAPRIINQKCNANPFL